MSKINRKGFTLIELLAVIIILGVLLLVAIPAMTGVIENAKKDAFVSTAKNYIQQVRYYAIQGQFSLPGNGSCVYVPVSEIKLERGSTTDSVYDQAWSANQTYVVIQNTPGDNGMDEYTYYFAGKDAGNNGMELTKENDMTSKNVKRRSAGDIPSISGDQVVVSIGTCSKGY